MNEVLFAISLVMSLISLFVAFAIIAKNDKFRMIRVLALFIMTLATWTLSVNLLGLSTIDATNVLLVKISFASMLLASIFLIYFSHELVGKSLGFLQKSLLPASAVSGIGLIFTNVVVSGVSYTTNGFVVPRREGGYLLVIGMILVAFLYAHMTILNAWRNTKNVLKKRQIGTILLGLFAGTIMGVLTNIVLPNAMGSVAPARLSFISMTIWTCTLLYAIVKHRFFSVRPLIARTFGYVLSLGVLAAMYAFVVFGLFDLYVRQLTQNDLFIKLSQISVTILLALSFAPLKRFFDSATNRLFYRDAYDPQKVIDAVNEVLVASNTLKSLGEGVAKILRKVLNTDYVFIQFHSHDHSTGDNFLAAQASGINIKQVADVASQIENDSKADGVIVVNNTAQGEKFAILDSVGATAFFRVRRNRSMYGSIVVGHKISNDKISREDRDILKIVSDELAIAVQNALYVNDIQNFSDVLKVRIEEATQELRVSNKKLKQMDQTKDEFISLTSHQLRTPLTTIKGYLSMLLDGDVGEMEPQQRKLIEEAFNSSQRMVHLISDFLNISRIQTGKFVIDLADVNLADILDEEIDQLRISANSRQLTLQYDKPDNFPIMPVDEGKIRQVMMNFIDNAIYYSLGGSTITIILSYTASTVEFTVIDQGIGVPKAEQHRLFAKFSRASNAKKQRPDGTGIGLFMAKKVIVALEGSIIFKSEEGKGSTFGFRLNRPSA